MGLHREFEAQGQWLFRWRSVLPFLFTPLIVLAVADMHWPFGSARLHTIWEYACLTVSLLGLAIRVFVAGCVPAGTSGRNTKGQCAASLNTTGLYSLTRHPLYLGNYLIGLGAMMTPSVWWLPVIYSISFVAYYERIMFAEEAFLRKQFGVRFSTWAEVTPAFLPNFARWNAPSLGFSVRSAMRREYTALFVIIASHSALEIAGHAVVEHRYVLEAKWAFLLLAGAACYFTLRGLKKYSRLLNVSGR
ncbi:methyltransferase family protein [Lacipirellula sp.]|uniref:methyltransferase family protein n=1 Tax=Lacipirellula sp. TaxID=2691419 RepID=UPI003D09DA79